MTHTDGFIPIEAPKVLYLLSQVPNIQFWRLDNWPQLFHRCGCCDAQKVGAYQMIGHDEARQ
jgi:hypothetical protein